MRVFSPPRPKAVTGEPRRSSRTLITRAKAGFACALLAFATGSAEAQWLPEEPISIAGGHFVLGAEVVATVAPDDPGFFNYTSYEYSAIRNFRLGVSAEIRANEYVQVLGEVRLDQGRVFDAYGLFVRIRPWPTRRFDLQAGRIPPTFGAMTRSAYGSGNLLVGQPLAYQYLLSIRPDALPANADDLLRMRGRGWLSNFPVGNVAPGPGLPMINTSHWDTGVQAHGVNGIFEWTGAVTVGSLSDPRLHDNTGGKQLVGRVVTRPSPAFAVAVSAARGPWLDRTFDTRAATPPLQTAVGGDAEFSAGRVLIRGEAIRSSWVMPGISAPLIDRPLVATSMLLEGRYKIAPGAYVAARGDRLDFGDIMGSRGRAAWDADTWRVEIGGGYSITRNILAKGAWQRNRRRGGRVPADSMVTAQVLYWF
jgi:hypothetical protein